MKILNAYPGIGGNRKHWGDEHEITAVELDETIAEQYQEFFKNDRVIVGDAHEFILKYYKEFDFIWASPPCPSHSRMNTTIVANEHQRNAQYPDMRLYQEIILLKQFFKGKFCIENVIPYYTPLITPRIQLDRHLFWSNFHIGKRNFPRPFTMDKVTIKELSDYLGFKITKKLDKIKVLRNCTDPAIGLHIFNNLLKPTNFGLC